MSKNSNKNILNLFSFSALIIVAILVVINNLLPIIGVEIKGSLMGVLSTIKDVLILLVVGLSAYAFVEGKTKAWKITFWVSVAVFAVGIILIWF